MCVVLFIHYFFIFTFHSKAEEKEELKYALLLLVSSLRYSARNVNEMKVEYGYEIVALILKGKTHLITPGIVKVMCVNVCECV